jgi:hypothetical protein
MLQIRGNFNVFPDVRPAAIVVSHERSGTHFLMNSLAACYGYVSFPWINFDGPTFNINYYYSLDVREILLAIADRPLANVVKSHHPAEFFGDELDRITERYAVFVVCRNPVAMMTSLWRYLHQWPFVEGPKANDPLSLARSEPCGRMMRYQWRQHRNMVQRWAAHVDGWLKAAQTLPRIVIVRYEDLDTRYEETMRSFASYLGREPLAIVRPARDFNVIPGGPTDPTGAGVPLDTEALRLFCEEVAESTMARLGYVAQGVASLLGMGSDRQNGCSLIAPPGAAASLG